MQQKLSILVIFSLVGFIGACAPHFKAFQAANYQRPCTQCSEILVTKTCTSDMHNSTFTCETPVVDYSVSSGPSPCARAMVTCSGEFGVPQNVGVVAKLASNATVSTFGSISSLQASTAHLMLKCNSESQWLMIDLDGNAIAQPLTLQCAHNHQDSVFETLAH